MRILLIGLGLVSLLGCVHERDPFAGCSGYPIQCGASAYPPPGVYPQGPMPTGVVPYGTLTPAPMLGEYWVTGQPTGTVHGH